MKEKKCKELGIQFELIKADERISSYELKKIIRSLNKSEEVTGIIIQLPLPKHLNKNDIINTISPEKSMSNPVPRSGCFMTNNVLKPSTTSAIK